MHWLTDWHVICDHWSQHFWSALSRRWDFWPGFPDSAPGQRCSWRSLWPLSRAKALQPWCCRSAPHCAAACHLRCFPGAVGCCGFRRTMAQNPGGGTAELYIPVQPTNEWWMFWPQHPQNCSKNKVFTNFTNTLNKFQYRPFHLQT